MWVKWVTIHESYGFSQFSQELRRFLETNGIRVRIVMARRAGNLYELQVPKSQQTKAEQYRDTFKEAWQ
ncbi:hypothetical protein ACAF76_013395 [Brevibacillus sp. TJ4]|uniref:hypothetical protein n=1 Tax=Brevibacillus sp. TJ4 TaxID=3234853 RepID=UPI003B9F1F34